MQRALSPVLDAVGIRGHWVSSDTMAGLGAHKGAYMLALDLRRPAALHIAKFAGCTLAPGRYLYLGSARGPGGIGARLKRHFRQDKALHWHIDHLTTKAHGMAALAVPDGNECALQEALLARPEFEIGLEGFGSTDCRRCRSHLLHQK